MANTRPILNGAYLLRPSTAHALTTQCQNPIIEKFQAEGLMTLLDFQEVVYPFKVREFYRHMHLLEENINLQTAQSNADTVYFQMEGRTFAVPLDLFSWSLSLPRGGFRFYFNSMYFEKSKIREADSSRTVLLLMICKSEYISKVKRKKTMKVKYIRDELLIQYRAIRENVTCRPMELDLPDMFPSKYVLLIEALMLHWMMRGIKFDIGFIIAHVMDDASSSINAPLPFRMRLTNMFRCMNLTGGPCYHVPPVPII